MSVTQRAGLGNVVSVQRPAKGERYERVPAGGGIIYRHAAFRTVSENMADEIQWSNPFDEAGIEDMADWMAPRFKESPIYHLAMDSADPDLLAVLLERLMNEYLEYRELDGRVRRDRNLVFVSMGEDDEDESTAVNISIPLVRALMLRLRGPGRY